MKGLLERAWRICSNYDLFHQEICKMKIQLIKNDYPIQLINSIVKKFIHNKHNKKEKLTTVKKKEIYLILPYADEKASEIKSELNEI